MLECAQYSEEAQFYLLICLFKMVLSISIVANVRGPPMVICFEKDNAHDAVLLFDINRFHIACSKKRDKKYIQPTEQFCLLLILYLYSAP